jgi:hypothetical protein
MASCSSGLSASAPGTPQCGSGHLERVIKDKKLSPPRRPSVIILTNGAEKESVFLANCETGLRGLSYLELLLCAASLQFGL